MLRGIVDAQWCVRNDKIHKDLQVPPDYEVRKFAQSRTKTTSSRQYQGPPATQ